MTPRPCPWAFLPSLKSALVSILPSPLLDPASNILVLDLVIPAPAAVTATAILMIPGIPIPIIPTIQIPMA